MVGKREDFLQNMMVFLSPYNRIVMSNKSLSNYYAQSSENTV